MKQRAILIRKDEGGRPVDFRTTSGPRDKVFREAEEYGATRLRFAEKVGDETYRLSYEKKGDRWEEVERTLLPPEPF
jgi:hypothetical protein